MSKAGPADVLVTGEELVAEVTARWRAGAPPDARAVLDEHPELAENHPLAMELIYEEFIFHAEAGSFPDEEYLATRFPEVEHSVRRMVQAHREVAKESAPRGPSKSFKWPKPGDGGWPPRR